MAKDTKAKTEFAELLKGIFGKNTVDDKCKTTDVILKIGNNQDDWYYFELKTTTIENHQKAKNKNKYFGAASLNQWLVAKMHPNHYFFVVAYRKNEEDNYKFCIIPPDLFRNYITGCYIHTDFNIPYSTLDKNGLSNDNIIEELISICVKGQSSAFKEEDDKSPNQNAIDKLDKYLEKENNSTN